MKSANVKFVSPLVHPRNFVQMYYTVLHNEQKDDAFTLRWKRFYLLKMTSSLAPTQVIYTKQSFVHRKVSNLRGNL